MRAGSPNISPSITVMENAKDGLKYVYIPPGTFIMGCSPGDDDCDDNEKPAHQVTITKGFWLGQTVVTVAAYERFATATGRGMPSQGFPNWRRTEVNTPMSAVSWHDAEAYCLWMGGRLPTEAEWEYAARAGCTQARYGPLDQIAWYHENCWRRATNHTVGTKRANGWGLFDMLGNVWEWVNDWYDENYYRTSPPTDPRGPASGIRRVWRGGSTCDWGYRVRNSLRVGAEPMSKFGNVGFRCAQDTPNLRPETFST